MASFKSILKVGGHDYDIIYSDLSLDQAIDSLGRPASEVHGGTITIEINTPANDPTLYEWMVNPEKRMDGQVVLHQLDSSATLKSIKFYNAYCVGMVMRFDGTANAASFKTTIRISPEQVEIGGLLHDNLWPDETPMGYIPDENGGKEQVASTVATSDISGATIPKTSKQASMGTRLPAPMAIKSNTSTCPESIRSALQRDVNERCKGDQSSCKGNDSCPILATKMTEQQACVQARWLIMVKCYKGGDANHKEQLQNRINGLIRCQELFARKCGSTPSQTPQPLPVNDPDFVKKMEQLTGLTGAALIVYLIISEGSRLFPPRNLVPIP